MRRAVVVPAGPLRRGRMRTTLIAATLGIFLTLSLAPSASAVEFVGGSGDEAAPPASSGTPKPQNPAPGGGGSTKPPAASTTKIWQYNSYPPVPGQPFDGCAASNGAGGTYLATKFRYRYPADMGLTAAQNAIRSGASAMEEAGIKRLERTCLYDGAFREETRKCVVSSTAVAKMILPRSVTLATETTTSAFGAGDRSIEACQGQTAANVKVNPVEYGRYRIDASSRVVNMVIQVATAPNGLTGAYEAPRIVSISGEYTTNPFSADGYLTCNGWSNGIPGGTYSWTANDCPAGPGDPGAFQCIVGGDPTISWRGETWRGSNAELLRDGSDVTFTWDAPTITGSGLQSVISTRSRMAVTDAPWSNNHSIASNFFGLQRDGARQNALNGADGTAWVSGLTSTWTAQWYQPTTYPTVLKPEYGFTADYVKNSVQITGVDANGFIATPVQVIVRADASCSAQAVAISTLRVVNG